jgi:predicted  nucleic acid-binding Zn-ribbon protein
MTSPTPDPIATGLQLLIATRTGEQLQQLLTSEGQQAAVVAALAALSQKIHNLEGNLMATAEEFATRLNTATDEIARDLQALRDQLQTVRDEIPAAQQAAVDAALAQLDAPIARLEALGQDPQNPVPDPQPEPGDEEPSPEPAPPTP